MQQYPGPWHVSLIFERLLARKVHGLEYDPHIQYRFHQTFAILWFCALWVLPFFPKLYGHSVSALIIQEISLWANFATDFGAMSAALAAGNYHCPGCKCGAETVVITPDAPFIDSEQKTYTATPEASQAEVFEY